MATTTESLTGDQILQLIQSTIQRADEIKMNLNKIVQTGSERVEQLTSLLPADKIEEAKKVIGDQTSEIQQSLDQLHEVGVQKMGEIQNLAPERLDSVKNVASEQADQLKRNCDVIGEAARKKMMDIATTVNADIEEARKLMAVGQQRS